SPHRTTLDVRYFHDALDALHPPQATGSRSEGRDTRVQKCSMIPPHTVPKHCIWRSQSSLCGPCKPSTGQAACAVGVDPFNKDCELRRQPCVPVDPSVVTGRVW